MFTKKCSEWSLLFEHRGSLRIEQNEHEGRASWDQGARPPAYGVPGAETLPNPPGKDGGDDRAPGHYE